MALGNTSRRGPRAIAVGLPKQGMVTVYAGARVADALEDVTAEMTLFQGVKLGQVLEAIYDQGLRDGRRQVFDELDKVKDQPALKHRNPGRPVVKSKRKTKVPREY